MDTQRRWRALDMGVWGNQGERQAEVVRCPQDDYQPSSDPRTAQHSIAPQPPQMHTCGAQRPLQLFPLRYLWARSAVSYSQLLASTTWSIWSKERNNKLEQQFPAHRPVGRGQLFRRRRFCIPPSDTNQNKQKRKQMRASLGLQVSSVASFAIVNAGYLDLSSISLLEVNK